MSEHPYLLLIDDNRSYVETLAEYLREKGLPVMVADRADEGLEMLDKHPAVLVICDFNMPGMDGLELVKHLRKHRAELGVMMLSSQDEPEMADRAMAAGALDFIAKNAPPRVLLQRVRQLLKSRDSVVLQAVRLEPWQKLLPPGRELAALPCGSSAARET